MTIKIEKWTNRTPLESGIEEGIEWAIYGHDSIGSINGYARIPEGHEWRKLDDWRWDCSAGVEIHGGITFGITNDGWIGFDTSHAGDIWAGSSFMRGLNDGDSFNTHWTQELVVEETKNLARQIAKAWNNESLI
jgi:hypothetical protein